MLVARQQQKKGLGTVFYQVRNYVNTLGRERGSQ